MKTTTVLHITVALLILLFSYAAVSKLLDYHTFSLQLSKTPVLGAFSGIIAWLLPTVEIATVVLLLIPQLQLLGLYISAIMLVSFTVYIGGVLAFADHIPCSCGGILQGLRWREHIVFNCFFIVLSILAIIYHKVLHRRTTTSSTRLPAF